MGAAGHRAACAAAVAFAWLVAGCAQTGAPVVDKPVEDWKPGSSARTTAPPARGAATPAVQPTPAKPAAPAAPAVAEPDWRPELYTVKRGDTLYSVALDHGQSYRDIAAWNAIADPNVILVGQQLRVRPPPGWAEPGEAQEGVVTQALPPPAPLEAKPLEPPPPPPLKSGPKAVKVAYSERALAQLKGVPYKEPGSAATPASKPSPAAVEARAPQATASGPSTAPAKPPLAAAPKMPVTAPAAGAAAGGASAASRGWIWPARGRLLHPFNSGANPKGIAIGGEDGQAVIAAAPGKVVYSGSGLRGYGKLVIIKHDDTYLSVYAHNRELLVKEGQRVAQGERIAEMGSSEADRVGLHFEIRRQGKPVDPLQYLPEPGA